MKLREWNARLHGLVVFRSLLDDPVVAKLLDLTDRMEAGAPGYGPVCDAVAQFEAALFEHTTNWGSYLSAAVLEAETVCVRQAASGTLAPALQTALDSELAFLQALCGLTLDELLAAAGSDNPTMIRDIMNQFINDEDTCSKLVKDDMQFSNNKTVNEKFANDPSFGNAFLGGQNDTALYCELAQNIVFENHTHYDQVINESLQKSWREYCDGDVTEEQAMANFYALVSENYPTITTP